MTPRAEPDLWEALTGKVKGKSSLYSITERRVPELIPVLAVSL